jgi:GMP synthase (glutamine-hydrolysing)
VGTDATLTALFVQHQDDVPPGLIGERARERGMRVEVLRAAPGAYPDPGAYDLVVPLGSGDSAYDDDVPWIHDERAFLRAAVDAGVPVFGICFGAQILAHVLGGEVRRMHRPEIGWLQVATDDPDRVDPGPWLVWHFDVLTPPPGGRELARTPPGPQAFELGPHLGVQFHPEATPGSVASWARTYAHALTPLGLTPAGLVEETQRGLDAARRRAHRLFDVFVERSVLPRGAVAGGRSAPREG